MRARAWTATVCSLCGADGEAAGRVAAPAVQRRPEIDGDRVAAVHPRRHRVELGCRHPRERMFRHGAQRLGYHRPGGGHGLDFGPGLQLDQPNSPSDRAPSARHTAAERPSYLGRRRG
jgi:hypothetical protein